MFSLPNYLINFLKDADIANAKRREIEQEMQAVRERLEASQNAWAATRKELEEKEITFAK